MTVHAFRRRLVIGAPLLGGMAVLLGCAQAPPPPASAQVATSPDVLIRNLPPGQPALVATGLAAYGTVQAVDPSSREVVLRTASGGTLGLRAGPEFRSLRQLRPGTRVVAAYDGSGTARLMMPPRPGTPMRPGVQLGTVEAVEVGGRRFVMGGAQGGRRLVTIENAAMMAFATRLAPGDEVAVTTATP
ncbi:hypothetical protein GWK16_04035 [Roseomonas sp. JC162]|uniref:Uncharacterized protein n=1 Tax=Neoroseomonas marina TaxID=1232220 RepID=A0A848EA11_9PROT|nr:hypothetical protein [Neoroseomonas marina]NMJ40397.1 hypothetical protein [Neoroseomonas marina]